MKKALLLLILLTSSFCFSQQQNVTFSADPSTFNEDDEITITVSDIDLTIWGVTDIYLWAWSFDTNGANPMDSPTNGSWTNSDEAQKLTNNGNGTYSFTFTPTTLYNRSGIGSIGMLVKAKDGSGDKKSQDKIYQVGTFQLTLNAPTNTTTVLNSGETLNIQATSSLTANFTLKANGTSINQQNDITSYSFSPTVTENTTYVLEAVNNGDLETKTFQAVIRPTVTEASVPTGMLDGLNIDGTSATLVFYAPNKDFIYLIGNMNNWQIDANYLLNKDSSSDRFWIELTGLSTDTNYMYQYLIDGVLKVADPYSTMILTESNDQFIDATTYPNLPTYPSGNTNHAVTNFQIESTPYQWQTTNFTKPAKTDLVIYELLIRDFDALHSFDAVKTRLDYLQNLGINAIEFMPIMEFDGNESWGYNPSFHMALDKYYGTKNAFKQLIDECHSRGIAVILDIAFNHASGQNPYYRMWNTDNGGYGGQASADSPFFNQTATHSYSVFNDFNHSKQATKEYVKRISQYWIDEYKIDGFRWDLTKGFTQNCTSNDESCTNAYQQDRIDVLKEYADYQWEIDPDFYIIFEHLGTNNEETQWVNYRLSEGKGIMLWSNFNATYNEATMGYHDNGKSDFSWISYQDRGWSVPANVSYMESHDEERLMYKNIQYGNSSGNYDVKDLSTALDREEIAGAFYFTIPGPKMIWQFGELGYDISINYNGRTGNKPILWNYFDDQERKDVYDTWSKLIQLKLNYDIFKTSDFTLNVGNSNGLKTVHLTDETATDIKYITIIGNFGVTTQNINPSFQQTGTWYNLLDSNTTITVNNVNSTISLAPGEFKVYADNVANLSTNNIQPIHGKVIAYPNPTNDILKLGTSKTIDKVEIYNLLGKKINTFHFKNNQVDISDLAPGIYLLKIHSNDDNETKKFIKE